MENMKESQTFKSIKNQVTNNTTHAQLCQLIRSKTKKNIKVSFWPYEAAFVYTAATHVGGFSKLMNKNNNECLYPEKITKAFEMIGLSPENHIALITIRMSYNSFAETGFDIYLKESITEAVFKDNLFKTINGIAANLAERGANINKKSYGYESHVVPSFAQFLYTKVPSIYQKELNAKTNAGKRAEKFEFAIQKITGCDKGAITVNPLHATHTWKKNNIKNAPHLVLNQEWKKNLGGGYRVYCKKLKDSLKLMKYYTEYCNQPNKNFHKNTTISIKSELPKKEHKNEEDEFISISSFQVKQPVFFNHCLNIMLTSAIESEYSYSGIKDDIGCIEIDQIKTETDFSEMISNSEFLWSLFFPDTNNKYANIINQAKQLPLKNKVKLLEELMDQFPGFFIKYYYSYYCADYCLKRMFREAKDENFDQEDIKSDINVDLKRNDEDIFDNVSNSELLNCVFDDIDDDDVEEYIGMLSLKGKIALAAFLKENFLKYFLNTEKASVNNISAESDASITKSSDTKPVITTSNNAVSQKKSFDAKSVNSIDQHSNRFDPNLHFKLTPYIKAITETLNRYFAKYGTSKQMFIQHVNRFLLFHQNQNKGSFSENESNYTNFQLSQWFRENRNTLLQYTLIDEPKLNLFNIFFNGDGNDLPWHDDILDDSIEVLQYWSKNLVLQSNNQSAPSNITSTIKQSTPAKHLEEKQSSSALPCNHALKKELSKIEEKVGRFSEYKYVSCIYKNGAMIRMDSAHINKKNKPAYQFLTTAYSEGSLDLSENLTKQTKNYASINFNNAVIHGVTSYHDNSNKKNKLIVKKERIEELRQSGKLFINPEILSSNSYKSLRKSYSAYKRSTIMKDPFTYEDLATGICHAQETDFLITHKTSKNGEAISIAKNDVIEKGDPSILVLSIPALNYKYGNASKLSDDNQRKLMRSMFRLLFHVSFKEYKCQYIALPPAGLGEFMGGSWSDKSARARMYFEALRDVATEYPGLNIIYNPIPSKYGYIFDDILGGKNALKNVVSTTKDVNFVALEKTKEGAKCALHNPSDVDVSYGAADPGEYWKDGKGLRYVAEEHLGAMTTIALNGSNLNPYIYDNPIEATFSNHMQNNVKTISSKQHNSSSCLSKNHIDDQDQTKKENMNDYLDDHIQDNIQQAMASKKSKIQTMLFKQKAPTMLSKQHNFNHHAPSYESKDAPNDLDDQDYTDIEEDDINSQAFFCVKNNSVDNKNDANHSDDEWDILSFD